MQIAKARPIGDEEVRGINIDICFNCPEFNDDDWESRSNAFFNQQAQDLEEALYHCLPGATYDRLLGIMMRRKSSHLTVSYKTLFNGDKP